MPIDDESGEFIQPQKTYLDDVEIYDAELGGVVPAWKSLIYHGAKARQFAQLREAQPTSTSKRALSRPRLWSPTPWLRPKPT
jgi:hypothetical protein